MKHPERMRSGRVDYQIAISEIVNQAHAKKKLIFPEACVMMNNGAIQFSKELSSQVFDESLDGVRKPSGY